MRKLMWFALGFGAACCLGAYWFTKWLFLFAATAFLLVPVAFVFCKRWKVLRQIGTICIGFVIGISWFWVYDAVYLNTVREVDQQILTVSAQASDYSYQTPYGSAVEADLELDGKRYQVLLYYNGPVELKPGDLINGQFRIRLTHGGIEKETSHRGRGVFALCYPKSELEYIAADSVPAKYFPAVMRQKITNILDETFPKDTAFFAKALLLGDRTGVDYERNTDFKVSGISHIIAVSGLHVSILFSLVLLLSGKKRILTAVIGIPILVLFAAVAGFSPSITRACLMQILMIIALLLNREYDPPTALAFAAIAMLVVNPVVITSVSFQLSVGCMAGIFLFSDKIKDWILSFHFWRKWKGKTLRVRLRQWVAGGVSVTLSSMFFTTPLVAYYFDAVSLVGVVTNLLTLWAVNWIFYGIIAVCLLALIWMKGAVIAAWIVAWLIRYVLTVAQILSGFPLAAVYTESIYIVLWLVLCYVLIFVFLVFKKRQPVALVCCCTLGLCAALCCSRAEPLTDQCRMTVLDVGQGQCVLLQAEGKTVLVDCGGDSDSETADLAAETLLSMGIFRLDAVVLTHYDSDHAGGLPLLLSRVPADAVFLPEAVDNDEMLSRVMAYCSEEAELVEEDLVLSWGGTSMTVFAPILSTSDNERGLCVLFQGENCDILITGDLSVFGEGLLLYQKQIPELTVLVAGHHGSSKSTGAALLEATNPQYVFISVGEDNPYGHPHQEVLERTEKIGSVVYRTDLNGTIIFRR